MRIDRCPTRHLCLNGEPSRCLSHVSRDRIEQGYNQEWDLGVGIGPNRTALPRVTAAWPNCLKLNLTGTNFTALGQSNAVTLYYQWARPETSNAIVSLFLDDDYNPWNGNEHLLQQATVSGTAPSFLHTAGHNVTAYGQLRVTFCYKAVSMEAGKDFMLEDNSNGGSAWQTVQTCVSGPHFANDQFLQETVIITPSALAFTSNVKLRFHCDAASNGDDIYIDEIEFAGQ